MLGWENGSYAWMREWQSVVGWENGSYAWMREWQLCLDERMTVCAWMREWQSMLGWENDSLCLDERMTAMLGWENDSLCLDERMTGWLGWEKDSCAWMIGYKNCLWNGNKNPAILWSPDLCITGDLCCHTNGIISKSKNVTSVLWSAETSL